MKQLKWKVQPVPACSFANRGWPTLEDKEGDVYARIDCEDEYEPSRAKIGVHGPLLIYVADRSIQPFEWRKIKMTASTLGEAKHIVDAMFKLHPEFIGE